MKGFNKYKFVGVERIPEIEGISYYKELIQEFLRGRKRIVRFDYEGYQYAEVVSSGFRMAILKLGLRYKVKVAVRKKQVYLEKI